MGRSKRYWETCRTRSQTLKKMTNLSYRRATAIQPEYIKKEKERQNQKKRGDFFHNMIHKGRNDDDVSFIQGFRVDSHREVFEVAGCVECFWSKRGPKRNPSTHREIVMLRLIMRLRLTMMKLVLLLLRRMMMTTSTILHKHAISTLHDHINLIRQLIPTTLICSCPSPLNWMMVMMMLRVVVGRVIWINLT